MLVNPHLEGDTTFFYGVQTVPNNNELGCTFCCNIKVKELTDVATSNACSNQRSFGNISS